MNRLDAISKGIKYYDTEILCIKGHLSQRRVSNRSCLECERERNNTDKAKISRENWRKSEKGKENIKLRNADPISKAARKKYEESEIGKTTRYFVRIKRQSVLNAYYSKRRADKTNQTPSWSETEKN